MPAYALTIFIGAFLLFQVQPLIGKYILPWFGGGPGVWTTCMLFFQMLLLGGYAYAHFSSRLLKPRQQAGLHLLLLAAALALLPIIPGNAWKPQGGANPTLAILALLIVCLGLPYFVLSSTGPLMQKWFSQTHPHRSPYRLYALSNVGSLLALVSYPFYFETHFTRRQQAGMWGWGLGTYALCGGYCALKLWKSPVPDPIDAIDAPEASSANAIANQEPPNEPIGTVAAEFTARPTFFQMLLWLLLPACASVLLLAITNKLCLDVAVIPFLWVLPLALYLLTFIICFDSPRWYKRFPSTLALIAAAAGLCWALADGGDASIYKQVEVYAGALFICCMVCHGELYRLRPAPRNLTTYYLMIAAGGALGGLFVAVIAPFVFTDYYELHCGLFLCAVLFLAVCTRDWVPRPKLSCEAAPGGGFGARLKLWFRDEWQWLACTLPLVVFGGLDWFIARVANEHAKTVSKGWFIALRIAIAVLVVLFIVSWIARKKFKGFQHWRLLACIWLSLGVIALGGTLYSQVRKPDPERVYSSRNFYGMLTVYERRKDNPEEHYYLLQHGRITHGLQFTDPDQSRWATTYYGEGSGVGMAARAMPPTNRRIGVVGLGTGTTAAFGHAGDYVRIYEINPQVQRVATSWFTYVNRCAARVEVALGDARLSMERELPQGFDLLVLDAFSSDAIPVHLLTKEAFQVYERHVKSNGVIAVHISNHYLDLEPVVVNLARQFSYKFAAIDYDDSEGDWWEYSSTWILLSHNEDIINSPAIGRAAYTIKGNLKVPLWTDDFASLFQILRK